MCMVKHYQYYTLNCSRMQKRGREMCIPMLSVTVMIFRDIVESVMLLNDDAWKKKNFPFTGVFLS